MRRRHRFKSQELRNAWAFIRAAEQCIVTIASCLACRQHIHAEGSYLNSRMLHCGHGVIAMPSVPTEGTSFDGTAIPGITCTGDPDTGYHMEPIGWRILRRLGLVKLLGLYARVPVENPDGGDWRTPSGDAPSLGLAGGEFSQENPNYGDYMGTIERWHLWTHLAKLCFLIEMC